MCVWLCLCQEGPSGFSFAGGLLQIIGGTRKVVGDRGGFSVLENVGFFGLFLLNELVVIKAGFCHVE